MESYFADDERLGASKIWGGVHKRGDRRKGGGKGAAGTVREVDKLRPWKGGERVISCKSKNVSYDERERSGQGREESGRRFSQCIKT